MITVGIIDTDNGGEYFAAFGGWSSHRSYPGVDGLRKACAESHAYQEWLMLRKNQQAFDVFWERYWDEHREYWKVHWDQKHWDELRSDDCVSTMRDLPKGHGLTLSPLWIWSKRYSFVCQGHGVHEFGFDSPKAALEAFVNSTSPNP